MYLTCIFSCVSMIFDVSATSALVKLQFNELLNKACHDC